MLNLIYESLVRNMAFERDENLFCMCEISKRAVCIGDGKKRSQNDKDDIGIGKGFCIICDLCSLTLFIGGIKFYCGDYINVCL